jgi:hypothetical protein
MPEDEFAELESCFNTARTLLQKTQYETDRIRMITVKCQNVFKALTSKMRLLRDRYFKTPLLAEEDWTVLSIRTTWGALGAEFKELGAYFNTAQTFLQKAQDKAEKTQALTAECQSAFKALSVKMRFFHDQYFKTPPLTKEDWAALGFKTKGSNPTVPAFRLDSAPLASLSCSCGPHALMVHLGPMVGTQEIDHESDYGYAVYLGVMPPGGAALEQAVSDKRYLMKPPADGDGLLYYRFTRRRKEKIRFDAKDAGKTAYVCCRYENYKGEEGRWGPVVSAVIP